MDPLIEAVIVLLAAAFLPPIVYMVWIRNTERHTREPYGRLARVFLYGAVFSIIIAVFFELVLMALFHENVERVYELFGENPEMSSLFLACVIAPVVEEFAKALGVIRSRRFIAELEDGIVFGAAAGLGFAATENLIYEGTAFFSSSTEVFVSTVVIRSVASALLHATASSVVGLGIARSALQRRSWLPHYAAAVLLHSAYNFAASFGELYVDELGEDAYLIGLVTAVMMAVAGISIMRSKIRRLETTG